MSILRPESPPLTTDAAWSVRMADSMLARHDPALAEWHYEHGLLLQGIEAVGRATGDPRYGEHVKATVDLFVEPDGTISTYRLEEYNLDQINYGKRLFPLYKATGELHYRKALNHLRDQLATHPRTVSGGFWHKQIYPYQMWLDGLYMAGPFYAEYGQQFEEPTIFEDIAHQVALVEAKTRDPASGLLYHAWDESKQMPWSNPETGCSPHFWARAMGWFGMALVDILDFFPADHPHRGELIAILERLMHAVAAVQDEESGVWYQIVDQGEREGNYLEASASCMFVYALAKGIGRGYLPASFMDVTRRGYQGILNTFITVASDGMVTLKKTCAVAGLGGNPYRDGSFDYYVTEPLRDNDYKGVGPFILAALEMEQLVQGGEADVWKA